jgi:hypothetical protein
MVMNRQKQSCTMETDQFKKNTEELRLENREVLEEGK